MHQKLAKSSRGLQDKWMGRTYVALGGIPEFEAATAAIFGTSSFTITFWICVYY
jgi:hypothetical protein